MSGGGIGGALGAGAGMLLAPETGGASLLLPAALGAAGGALGAGVTGGNPLTSGLLGGAGGLAGGFLSGLLSPGADAAATAAGDPFATSAVDTAAPELAGETNALDTTSLGSTAAADPGNLAAASGAMPSDSSSGSWLSHLLGGPSTPSTGNVSGNDTSSKSSDSGGLLSKQNLPYIGLGLSALGALMPSGSNPVNIGGNAANVQGTNPGFNAPLPQFNYNNVQTPYTGNWYTYGQRPVSPMVQNTLTPAKRGGLMGYAQGGKAHEKFPAMPPMRTLSVQDIANALPRGAIPDTPPQQPMPMPQPIDPTQTPVQNPAFGGYAMGGRVRGFAMGGRVRRFAMGGMPPQGMPMAAPQGMPMGGPPQGMPQMGPPGGGPPQASQDPRAQAMQFALGQKLGKLARNHITKQSMFTADGMVNGAGKGQDDAVPAKLSKDEYVIPADVTSMLGDGSSSAGGKELDKMVHKVRAHKATKHFPPKAKNPLAYIGKR